MYEGEVEEEEAEEEEWSEERLVQLRLRYAINIPKVDVLSESDPYVVLQLPGRSRKPCRTATIQDDPNPVWEEDFFFECMCLSNGRLEGVIEMDVMDEDMVSDSLIGKTTLDLSRYDPLDWELIELPLVLVDKVKTIFEKQLKKQQQGGFLSLGRKQASPDLNREHAPCVVLSIVGTIPSFSTVQHSLSELPGVIVDPKARMVLAPLPGYPVLTGVQYSSNPRKGPRMCLLSTQAWTTLSTGLRLDFELPAKVSVPHGGPVRSGSTGSDAQERERERGGPAPRRSHDSAADAAAAAAAPPVAAVVERMQFPGGRRLNSELRVFEEVALLNLPLGVDLSELLITLAPKLPTVAAYDVCALLTGAGWQGPGFSFKAALSHMRDYVADSSASKQELFVMTDGEVPPCCVLALDFKDMQHTALGATPHIVAYLNKSSELYWELGVEGEGEGEGGGGGASQATELHYARSVSVLKGERRFRCRRRLQLCDPEGRLACREDLGGLQLLGFDIDYDNCQTWTMAQVLSGDFGAEQQPEDKHGAGSNILGKVLGSLKSMVRGIRSKSK